MWTLENLTWKFNFGTLVPNGTFMYNSHQNAPIIEPIGAFFVTIVNNEVIHHSFLVFSILQGLKEDALLGSYP